MFDRRVITSIISSSPQTASHLHTLWNIVMLSGHGWKIGRAVMNTHRLAPGLVYVGNGDEDEVALSIISKHLHYVRRALLERGVET